MVSVSPDLSIVTYCQFNRVQNSAKISWEYDNFCWIVAGLFLFLKEKIQKDIRFRWPLPNIRFRPNIRPIVSAETTFGRTLILMLSVTVWPRLPFCLPLSLSIRFLLSSSTTVHLKKDFYEAGGGARRCQERTTTEESGSRKLGGGGGGGGGDGRGQIPAAVGQTASHYMQGVEEEEERGDVTFPCCLALKMEWSKNKMPHMESEAVADAVASALDRMMTFNSTVNMSNLHYRLAALSDNMERNMSAFYFLINHWVSSHRGS
jgi:hypothetical protein